MRGTSIVTSPALAPEADIWHEDSSGCDVVYTVGVTGRLVGSGNDIFSGLWDVWRHLLRQDTVDLYRRDLRRQVETSCVTYPGDVAYNGSDWVISQSAYTALLHRALTTA